MRTRPTREQTRQRLFEAAAKVFEEEGIGAATIEAITEAAGYTRGAFYSNFVDLDDLVGAMLHDHIERSAARYVELVDRSTSPSDLMSALREVDRSVQDPLGRSPVLHHELVLYATRAESTRAGLVEYLRARRAIVEDVLRRGRLTVRVDASEIAKLVLAIEDGFRLHQLIDPATTPSDSFVVATSLLWEMMTSAHS